VRRKQPTHTPTVCFKMLGSHMPCVRELDVIKYVPIKVGQHITYELCPDVINVIFRTLHDFIQLLKKFLITVHDK
jgi:hypothetical protein